MAQHIRVQPRVGFKLRGCIGDALVDLGERLGEGARIPLGKGLTELRLAGEVVTIDWYGASSYARTS